MLAEAGKTLADKVAESYREITADFTTPDAEMLMRLTRDTWQFSTAKNYQELRDLTLILKDEAGNLREWSSFKEAAGEIGVKYNETWMRTEYDQAIAGAQNAARWTEFEREKDIIPNLKYQTVGDSAVRPEHQVLDGIIKPMDSPFWATHYPPNGWGCRCEALQSLEGEGQITPDRNIPNVNIAPMFRTNLAKIGLIYPKNHPYYNGIPRAELRKDVAYLPPVNTYQSVVIGDHGIDIHPLHGEKELGKNIESCNTLLKHDPEAKLKLLPIINENEIGIKGKFYPKEYVEKFDTKNADCLYGKKVVEFEEPVLGSKNSIKNAIRGGKEQADTVFLRVKSDLNKSELQVIENEIYKQLGHYRGQDFKVYLMNDDILKEYTPKAKQD